MAQSRTEAIAASYRQAKDDPPIEWLIVGMGAVVALFVIGHFVRLAQERRRLKNSRKGRQKER